MLEISEDLRTDARIVSIGGELDLHGAPAAQELLERAAADNERALVIDLTACEFIDSTGLATIVHSTRPLRDAGKDVSLVCPAGHVRKLLELAALELTFPIHDRIGDAIPGG